ncbi:MAG TPA: N(5)-(carboxyethyl)ornithine synthase [Solirubrobacteraceae bacterium]|nr:N(5)-(carboxyethyl)ornithine synthase [Solirubrobacteraceae bacterium]
MEKLSLGVVGTSRKPDEHRLPIHPAHLGQIDPELRRRMFLEQNYGQRFGVSDDELGRLVGGIWSREQLLEECDVVVLPKPLAEDLAALRPGRVLWGWPHCVQDEALTQIAIDRHLTLIAWEAMNHWTHDGNFSLHVFHKNNELAGYCSVLHALQLIGTTGAYGRRLTAAVISFGATARGAVTALFALGVHEVNVLTHRSVPAVAAPMAPARLVHYERDPEHPHRTLALHSYGDRSMAEFLAEHDIVVNCVLQDTDNPLMFVTRDELELFTPGSVFIDVSCDQGMGFEWARSTSFADPLFSVAPGVRYYAVDHSPAYLWSSATWEISEALLPFLETVMSGRDAWEANQTIRRAIEIRAGAVQNPKILSFQSRSPEFPHLKL